MGALAREKMECPECHGSGGHIESVLDYGGGPFIDCGFCEGLGEVLTLNK